MHNLKLQCFRELESDVKDIQFVLLDPNASYNGNYLYAVTRDTVLGLNFDNNTVAVKQLLELPGIVGAEYLALENKICVATDGGEVLCLDPKTGQTTEGTFCEVGLERMAWSYDQEVVVFVTKSQQVVVMAHTFDAFGEHLLQEQCNPDAQFVNVGWGKKETQFHGSEGKKAAKQKTEFQTPDNVDELPKDISISWRADSKYFAVSFVSTEMGRMFKVFNKEGGLEYISERMNDLQPALAWRPSGTWIAIPQRLPAKSTIALCEKNGLRHREIVLPFDLTVERIVEMRWSADSNVLAIETCNADTQLQSLYFYTIGNYHWYLKQVLRIAIDEVMSCWQWDPRIDEELTLHVCMKSGIYQHYTWRFGIDVSCSGLVAVIDGKKLLLTDFTKAIVPPPMCAQEVQMDDFINSCVGCKELPQFVAVDVGGNAHLIKPTPDSKEIAKLDCETVRLWPDVDPPYLRQVAGLEFVDRTYLAATRSFGCDSNVFLMSITKGTHVTREIPGIACNVCPVPNSDVFMVQTLDGQVYEMKLSEKPANSWRYYTKFEQAAERLVSYGRTLIDGESRIELLALLRNRRLYLNDQLLSSEVTSFCVTGGVIYDLDEALMPGPYRMFYVAYTHLCDLEFVCLLDQRLVDSRKMERGAKLVAIAAPTGRTVLQMPRGNLETIQPRVLSLEIFGEYVQANKYDEAFKLLRKERMNLNLLCDHDMERFMKQLVLVMRKLGNNINLFLNELKNEDITTTMYASFYHGLERHYPPEFDITKKIDLICSHLLAILPHEIDSQSIDPFATTRIVAFVKIGRLDMALKVASREYAKKDFPKHGEQVLKYLFYVVDVNALYDVALSTYDLTLTLFIAQRSQKDPKEYLPFLNELQQYDENYRKFKIDQLLKRYDLAISHLIQCGAECYDEAFSFIEQYKLYARALACLGQQHGGNEEDQAFYKRVCLAYADYLRNAGKFYDASVMYERGGDLVQAMHSAKHVLDWQRVLVLAKRSGSQDVPTVALSMVSALEEQNEYIAAYQLIKTYINRVEALKCLLRGRQYIKAIFEARFGLVDKDSEGIDLIKDLIRPSLLEGSKELQMGLANDLQLTRDYTHRLVTVRQQRAQKQFNGSMDQYEPDEIDCLSTTTSMRSSRFTGSTAGSGSTFRSSKNRRKHQRKILSLKQGGTFEEIGLIDAIYNLIVKMVGQQTNVKDCCKALIELQEDFAAAFVQETFRVLLHEVEEISNAVWIAEVVAPRSVIEGTAIDYAQLTYEQRYMLLEPRKRFRPDIPKIDWEYAILS